MRPASVLFALFLVSTFPGALPATAEEPRPAEPAPSRIDSHGFPLPEFAVARCGSAGFRHAFGVWNVLFTPDGRHLVSVAGDSTIRVWEAGTGIEKARRDLTIWCHSVDVSRDGSAVAIAGRDGEVRVLKLPGLDETSSLKVEEESPLVALSPDGKRLAASAGKEAWFTIWDLETGKETARFGAELEEGVCGLAWLPSGEAVVAVTPSEAGGRAAVWNVKTGENRFDVRAGSGSASQVEASGDGRWILVLVDGEIKRISAETGEHLDSAEGHGPFALLPDAGTLVYAARDQVLETTFGSKVPPRVVWRSPWDRSQEPLNPRRRPDPDDLMNDWRKRISCVSVSPDGGKVAIASEEHVIRIVDRATGKDLFAHEGNNNAQVYSMALSPDGTRAATGTMEQGVQTWDLATGKFLGQIGPADATCFWVAWSPDGKRIATCGRKALDLWTVETSTRYAHADLEESARAVGWFPDGEKLALIVGKSIREWKVTSEKLGRTFYTDPIVISGFAISPDGGTLATGPRGARFLFVNTGTLDLFARVPTERNILQLCFSGDGRFVAGGGSGRKLTILDARDGRLAAEWPPLPEDIASLAWSPDGRFIAAACGATLAGNPGGDMAIRLYDVASGGVVRVLVSGSARSYCMAFTPDSRRLITGMEDGTVLVWDVNAACGLTEWTVDPPEAEELEKAWFDLGAVVPREAWKAGGILLRGGRATLDRFGPRLCSEGEKCAEAPALIAALGDDDPEKRQRAFERLGELDAGAEIAAALLKNPEAEVAARLRSLLELDDATPSVELMRVRRQVRAFKVIEEIAAAADGTTPKLATHCRQVVQAAADRAPMARVRREAAQWMRRNPAQSGSGK